MIPLSIQTVVASRYPKPKKSRENWHVLQKEPIGFSIYSPIYTLPSHTPSQRTKIINGIIARIPGHRSLDANRSLFYFLQGPCAAYFICHETCGTVNTSLFLPVQYQQNYACRNRILLQQSQARLRHQMGNTIRSSHPLNTICYNDR